MSIAFALLGLTLVFCRVSCDSDSSDDSTEKLLDRLARQNDVDRFRLRLDRDWPSASVKIGQLSGVAFRTDGNAVLFHRGSRRWTANDFEGNLYQKVAAGKVKENTLVVVDPEGRLVESWGADLFYMPHGLSIDSENNVWVTDVASHQVFKFAPDNKKQPALVLGEALKPGSDATHFCQPTDVAVASNGDFFVADGYCNSRILKFDRTGKLLAQIESDESEDSLTIPHSLALVEEQDAICVADRENERIQCFSAGLQNATSTGELKAMLMYNEVGPVYAVAYDKVDAMLHGVGLGVRGREATGFSIDLTEPELPLVGTWMPRRGFRMPHDLAVSADGQRILVGDVKANRAFLFTKEY